MEIDMNKHQNTNKIIETFLFAYQVLFAYQYSFGVTFITFNFDPSLLNITDPF